MRAHRKVRDVAVAEPENFGSGKGTSRPVEGICVTDVGLTRCRAPAFVAIKLGADRLVKEPT